MDRLPKVKCKTIKFQGEYVGENLCSLPFSYEFLDTTQKAKCMKEKVGKLDFITITNVCSVKTLLRESREAMDWEKYLKTPYLKESNSIQNTQGPLLINNKKNNPIRKNWAKDLKTYLIKKTVQLVNKHMKGCSTSYIIREV